MSAIVNVIRGEGWASAVRRTNERIAEAAEHVVLRTSGVFARRSGVPILNVSATSIAPRTGGVATQLAARLHEERARRDVALLHPGGLRLSAPFPHERSIAARGFESRVREALRITGAQAIQLDGTSEVPFEAVLRLRDDGIAIMVSVHDFSLFCARPHLLEQPQDRFCFYSHDLDRCHHCLRQTWDVARNAQAERQALARRVLETATAVIFPSPFLLEQHRELFALPDLQGTIIEPAPSHRTVTMAAERRGVACAGSVKRHKGGLLLPQIAATLDKRGLPLHVFGGGDADLLRDLRRAPNVIVHGYYRTGTLPSLLARHRIGLVVLPSIWPETYSLTLTETWQAGATAAAFDLGAPADRIRQTGGGRLTPLDSGAAGLAHLIENWLDEDAHQNAPYVMTSAEDAARAHVELYRREQFLRG